MPDQIDNLKIAMANQQTIDAQRWQQVSDLLKEMRDDLQKQRDEITQLKIQLAQGSGAIKFIMAAGAVVAMLVGLSRLLPVSGG